MNYDFGLNMNERRSQTVLLKKVKRNSVVLELGPYKGVMTRYMKNALNCRVYICELDPEGFLSARQYAEDGWLGNLETLDWVEAFRDIRFDCILCADVLEHLKNPDAVLRAAGTLLKEDGSVLLSVPNVAHNSVVASLCQNRFDYADYGILDRTHLRFFTYHTLRKLCGDAGFTPVEEDAIYQDYISPLPEQSVVNAQYGRVFQFVFELRKTAYAQKNHLPCEDKIEKGTAPEKERTTPRSGKSVLKLIAFYLPQFHRIKENEAWWGEGFTEWTHTKKARPLYEGHRQPREPLGDVYYDLSDVESIKRQAALMQKYRVFGLCFYHYWFSGRLLLEKPMELLLAHPEIDLHYCVSWANEPWTRNWNGASGEILMPQTYGNSEDWKRHFEYLLPFFRDDRYIKIDGKPLLILYLSAQIERCGEMMNYWRLLARENGFDGLYISETLGAKQSALCLPDSDACIEFEPGVTLFGGYTPWNGYYYWKTLMLFYYEGVWEKILARKSSYGNREKFCGAFVDWDNTPRVGMRGSVCIGATPQRFKEYLARLVKKCIAEQNDRFIFINAWNEWCEGAYLEPDKHNAFQYLEAIRDICEELL